MMEQNKMLNILANLSDLETMLRNDVDGGTSEVNLFGLLFMQVCLLKFSSRRHAIVPKCKNLSLSILKQVFKTEPSYKW